MNERRDLKMELVSASGHALSVPKGGLPVVDAQEVEVRAVYRGRSIFLRVPGDAFAEAVAQALLAQAEALDDEITLAELTGEVI